MTKTKRNVHLLITNACTSHQRLKFMKSSRIVQIRSFFRYVSFRINVNDLYCIRNFKKSPLDKQLLFLTSFFFLITSFFLLKSSSFLQIAFVLLTFFITSSFFLQSFFPVFFLLHTIFSYEHSFHYQKIFILQAFNYTQCF